MDLDKGLNLKDLDLNVSLVNILYRQYKEFILSLAAILVSVVLVIAVVIPQTQNLLKNREELKKEQEKLSVLKNNFSLLSGLDEADLSQNLQLLSRALPSGKDFIGIINTISYNSIRQDVTIDDFEFQVGDISENAKAESDSPFLNLTLNVSGNPQSVTGFISELYKSTPVTEVVNIKSTSGQGTLKLQFYYKAFVKSDISSEIPMTPLSKQENDLINTVSKWNDTSLVFSLPIGVTPEEQSATPSAGSTEPTSPF
ncbi:MAG: hypothetical protein COU25_00325 [Candidatus Levybacteria bacterium CG10_big_fil_rev_8_21_14_0_10_35_13]|nr:MAG: hypothetical protein COU25_00325 [Candidatus Levybacteria bacterium CG10_big_fil_rev_8_21_14_0_10_35_13]